MCCCGRRTPQPTRDMGATHTQTDGKSKQATSERVLNGRFPRNAIGLKESIIASLQVTAFDSAPALP